MPVPKVIRDLAMKHGLNPALCSHIFPHGPSVRVRIVRKGVSFNRTFSVNDLMEEKKLSYTKALDEAFLDAVEYRNTIVKLNRAKTGRPPKPKDQRQGPGKRPHKVCFLFSDCSRGGKTSSRLMDCTCKECLKWAEKMMSRRGVCPSCGGSTPSILSKYDELRREV